MACSLRTGTKVIAILHLIFTILAIILVGASLCLTAWAKFYVEDNSELTKSVILRPGNADFKIKSDNDELFELGLTVNKTTTEDETNYNLKVLTEDILVIGNKDTNENAVFVNMKLLLLQTIQMGIMVNVLVLMIMVYRLVLSLELLKGAKKLNIHKCGTWIRVEIANVILSVLMVPVMIIRNPKLFESEKLSTHFVISLLAGSLIGWLINLYFIWIVSSFVKQVKRGNYARNLSQKSLVAEKA